MVPRNQKTGRWRATHGMTRSPEYHCWVAMRARCTYPSHISYPRYGGRGIRVCSEWLGPGGFERFIACVGTRPSLSHTLDRIDNDGNYEPGNVRWADKRLQSWNSSTTKMLTIEGETLPINEWASRAGISWPAMAKRIRRGLTGSDLLAPPPTAKVNARALGEKLGVELHTVRGVTRTFREWCRSAGVYASGVREIMGRGLSLEEALMRTRNGSRFLDLGVLVDDVLATKATAEQVAKFKAGKLA